MLLLNNKLSLYAGKLYAVGGLVCGVGAHSGTPFRYCDNGSECFDPDTGQWSRVTPMNQCRSNHTVQPLGKRVKFVIAVNLFNLS